MRAEPVDKIYAGVIMWVLVESSEMGILLLNAYLRLTFTNSNKITTRIIINSCITLIATRLKPFKCLMEYSPFDIFAKD